MIQEYLFTTNEHKAEIESFAVPDKVRKEIRSFENSTCWTLCLSNDSANENAAKQLDSLNTQICREYKPTVLSNECSAYFNKSLYPIVNEFERKLRKLLYLASALQGDNDAQKVIVDLESKDLGEIFTALFTDADFVNCVREKVKQKSWRFTRAELFADIEELEEKVLWDTLLGCKCVKTLRNQFAEVKNYRNDVMHAHNINYAEFRTARQLFKDVNEELDQAIGRLIGAKEENEAVTPANFNSTFAAALSALQSQFAASSLTPITDLMKDTIISYQAAFKPEMYKSLSESARLALGEYTLKPEFREALSNLGKIAELKSDIMPAASALSEMAKQMVAFDIEVPPEVKALQHSLSEINMDTLLEKDKPTEEEEKNADGQTET